PSPGTDRGSRKPKLSASGLEHRPPEAPSLSMTAWPKDFVRVPSLGPHKGRSVRKMFGTQRPQPATLYAPKTHPGPEQDRVPWFAQPRLPRSALWWLQVLIPRSGVKYLLVTPFFLALSRPFRARLAFVLSLLLLLLFLFG
ncbi:unnamed protein product, partial [Polarella glacialis]